MAQPQHVISIAGNPGGTSYATMEAAGRAFYEAIAINYWKTVTWFYQNSVVAQYSHGEVIKWSSGARIHALVYTLPPLSENQVYSLRPQDYIGLNLTTAVIQGMRSGTNLIIKHSIPTDRILLEEIKKVIVFGLQEIELYHKPGSFRFEVNGSRECTGSIILPHESSFEVEVVRAAELQP